MGFTETATGMNRSWMKVYSLLGGMIPFLSTRVRGFRFVCFPEADPREAFSGRLSRISCPSCRDTTTYSVNGSCWDPLPILFSRLFASCLWYISKSRKHEDGDDRSRKRIIARAPAPGIGDTGEALFGMDDDNVSFGSILTEIALREI
jgi:hypothetical protein